MDVYKTSLADDIKFKNNQDGDMEILSAIEMELEEAAKLNPCPACKYDITQLARFVSAKKTSIQKRSVIDKEITKSLKEVDYINELADIAIIISKLIRPFTRISKIPEKYEKVLHDDMEANKKVKEHLMKANALTKELAGEDKQFKRISGVLEAFIRATEFKLSIDTYSFYLFDMTIKLGYKTHMLSVASKIIIGVKGILNPSRYK